MGDRDEALDPLVLLAAQGPADVEFDVRAEGDAVPLGALGGGFGWGGGRSGRGFRGLGRGWQLLDSEVRRVGLGEPLDGLGPDQRLGEERRARGGDEGLGASPRSARRARSSEDPPDVVERRALGGLRRVGLDQARDRLVVQPGEPGSDLGQWQVLALEPADESQPGEVPVG